MTVRFTMRIFLRSVWLLLMVPGLAFGQTAADVGAQLDALRDALLRTQQQVAAQQQEIQLLKTQLKVGQSGTGGSLISAVEVVRPNPAPPNVDPAHLSPD